MSDFICLQNDYISTSYSGLYLSLLTNANNTLRNKFISVVKRFINFLFKIFITAAQILREDLFYDILCYERYMSPSTKQVPSQIRGNISEPIYEYFL